MEVFTTTHSADLNLDVKIVGLRYLFNMLKSMGFDFVRTDWRWDLIEPEEGKINTEQLDEYAYAIKDMLLIGLKPPRIVLSSIPKWAKKIYQKNPEKFFLCYTDYLDYVKGWLENIRGEKVRQFQVLNEVNSKMFSNIRMEDTAELCRITRQVMGEYSPFINLSTTLFVGNLIRAAGTEAREFLLMNDQIFHEKFDIIGLDYYPGLLHWPLSMYWPFGKYGWSRKNMFGNLELLEETIKVVSELELNYEITEFGFCSDWPWGSQKRQLQFFEIFSRVFIDLLRELGARGIRLPSRVGVYQAMDEKKKNFIDRTRDRIIWEHGMGLIKSSGEPKLAAKYYEPFKSTISEVIRRLKEVKY